MAENTNLKVDELNFQLIKENLKQYLRTQDQFRDYNFESSGLNVLLDVLAYNTYYNSFYLNMISSESFLVTAQKRESVVNLAKSLNYIPKSISSSRVNGTITAQVIGFPDFVFIPKYTEFAGTIENRTLRFLTEEAVTLFNNSGTYSGNVTLIEGQLITRRYVVSSTDLDQRFLIPNQNVDTSTITVSILNSVTDSTTRTFIKAENIVNIDSTSQVYYIEEVEDGEFEIKFGDNVFGVKPNGGNLIVLQYLVSNGLDGNDALNLIYKDSISGITNVTLQTDQSSSGGSDRESVEAIRFNAPKSYEAQNRAVTAQDYASLMLSQPNIESVLVWGGEDNVPPTYGKVFIAAKPIIGNALTPTEKENIITTIISKQKVITISVEIVDPEFIYLLIDDTVKYDARLTNLSEFEIKQLVVNSILQYNDSDIDTFSKYFRYSKLSRLIDFSDKSILNNILTVRMRREVPINLGQSVRYEIHFSNEISDLTRGRPSNHPFGAGNQITSNAFAFAGFTNCFLDDNDGIIRIYRISEGVNVGVLSNAGTIDYSTGKIILTNFSPTSFADLTNVLKITAIPKNADILPLRNQILTIREQDINVSTIDDNSISLVRR
jgi:hypothetical protein